MQALPTPKKTNRPREAVLLKEGYGGGFRALLILLFACALLVAAFAAASQYMDDDLKAKADAKVNSLLGPEQS